MRAIFLAMVCALGVTTQAAQAVVISITGVPGDGIVTISVTGENTPLGEVLFSAPGTNEFTFGDSVEFPDYIAAPLDEVEVALTGGISVTDGTQTVQIAAIFLDNDTGVEGDDDFGFRADGAPVFAAGTLLTFSGAATALIDISVFNPVTLLQAGPQVSAFDQSEVLITIAPVPLPAGIGLALAGLGMLWGLRRVKRRAA